MTTPAQIAEAQAVIVAMLKECGLSQVNICVDPEYNRYTIAARNGGGGAFYRFTALAELRDERKPAPKIVQAGIFDRGFNCE
jgi:uncharacterized protein YigE (DUF2233 family)